MNKENKNLEEKEEKKTNLKDKMLSDDDLGQVSGGFVLSGEYSNEHEGVKWDKVAGI